MVPWAKAPGGVSKNRFPNAFPVMHFCMFTKAKKQDTGVRLELTGKSALRRGRRGGVNMNTVSKPGPLGGA